MVIEKLIFYIMRKFILLLLLTIPSLALAIDLEDYYITPKGGVSKTFNTGDVFFHNRSAWYPFQNNQLGTGLALGVSVGKYLNDNFRLELEATQRTGYKFQAAMTKSVALSIYSERAKIKTHALFINGFYDFQPFSINNTPITPYLGGGVGLSRNKMEMEEYKNGLSNTGLFFDSQDPYEFAYKLSAGTLFSLTEQLSLDVNYQYVNLGEFKSGVELTRGEVVVRQFDVGMSGGEIRAQELMIGLQYKF